MDMSFAAPGFDAARMSLQNRDIEAAKEAVKENYSAYSPQEKKYEARLREVSQEFASVLVGQMFKSMAQGLESEGVGFGGTAEKIFREMAMDEYARDIVKSQDMGMAEVVYRSLAGRQRAQAAYAGSDGETRK